MRVLHSTHRPTATSLSTKRDIIYLDPVICWVFTANQVTEIRHMISVHSILVRKLFAPFWVVFNVYYVITAATMQLWRLLDILRQLDDHPPTQSYTATSHS